MRSLEDFKFKYYPAEGADGRKRVIAVTRFADKTVRGVAICSSNDTFDYEKGKEIARARCLVKLANKRYEKAKEKRMDFFKLKTEVDVTWQNLNSKLAKTHADVEYAQGELDKILAKA